MARRDPSSAPATLEPPALLPEVAIRAGGSIHPFFYRKMVIGHVGGPRPQPGDLVRIVDREGGAVGFGLFNPRSEIVLRLVSSDPTPPGPEFWRGRLAEAVHLRRELLGLEAMGDAHRLIHAEADGLSGLIVDRLGDVLSAEVFSLGIYSRIDALLDQLAELTGVPRRVVRVDDRVAQFEGFVPRRADGPDRVGLSEHAIRYRVQFASGHKTGFFCDQRDNRRELAPFCSGRDVLDLCCYTGGFALNARIRGQAREVTGVDLDEKAIAQARDNANLNQVRINWVHADAFGYARQMLANGRQFGAVVLDPPKLIPTRDDVAPGKRKYYDLNALAFQLVEPGGLLLSCSCSGLLGPDEFVRLLRAAARATGREVQLLKLAGAAPDHPVALHAPESAYLKAAWLRVVRARPIADAARPIGPAEAPPPSAETDS